MTNPITLVVLDLDTPRYFSDGFYVKSESSRIGLSL